MAIGRRPELIGRDNAARCESKRRCLGVAPRHDCPPQLADPAKIRIVSGLPNDLTPGDNSEANSLVNPLPQYQAVQVFLEDATIGAQFRLNIALTARDCDGPHATTRDCVMIVVAEC